jgi:3-oxoacyl-[acyl-carrier-protein] synthase II
MRRVVITGLGAVTPCGNDVESTWRSMVEARSGVGPITRFDAASRGPGGGVGALGVSVAGEVRDFPGVELLGDRTVRRNGRFVQYALVAADEAMRDAGLISPGSSDHDVDPERLGVYVGSGIGGLPEIVDGVRTWLEEGAGALSPFFIPRCLVNLATGQIAIRYRARGPSLVVATACAVGNHSVGEAWRAIRCGDADVVLAGGTEASLVPLALAGFGAMRALSRGTDATASRPFDRSRDGFVMGEGAGVLVLESEDRARARGARIYAEITGYALTTDAHHVTAPDPDGEGAARCMRRALASAGRSPESVDYINAHGTSTPMNDPTETRAIRSVFGAHADRLAVSSTKGVTGHLLGAAGAVEAVACARVLFDGVVPPTAHLTDPDSACDLDYVPGVARSVAPRVVVSNAFGFGGTNSAVVFERWEG